MSTEKQPFFSVVIPLYNKQSHVKETIETVLAQTFHDFEVVVVNDGSKDDSAKIVESIQDERIRLIHQENAGVSVARNRGIKESKAEYIAFLDADDLWLPDFLQTIYELIHKFPDAGLYATAYKKRKANGEESGINIQGLPSKDYVGIIPNYFESVVKGDNLVCSSAVCIPRKVFEENDIWFPEGELTGEDQYVWGRVVMQFELVYSQESLAIYNIDAENNTMSVLSNKAGHPRFFLFELKKYSGLKKSKNLDAWLEQYLLRNIIRVSLNGKKIDSLKQIYICKLHPKNLAKAIFYLFFPKYIYVILRNNKDSVKNGAIRLKQSILGKTAKKTITFCLRLKKYGLRYHAQNKHNIITLSDRDNPTFFGYHDKTPFSLDGEKVLAMSITASDTDPESECTPMKLGYFKKDTQRGFANDFIPFATTRTWCWQQGCMLQWYPKSQNNQVVYNDLVDGKYGSVLFDIKEQKAIKKFNYPIYSLSSDGDYAATLNFSRLGRLRPGYGYMMFEDESFGVSAPEDDGLFLMELATRERKLLVSLKELAKDRQEEGVEHYVNHATFSPDGKKIVFFHLWAYENDNSRGLRVCEYDLQNNNWKVVEDQRIVSHYAWLDDSGFISTGVDKNKKWHYSFYNLEKSTREDLDLPFYSDGHPMYHPVDKNIIVTDSYPDRARDQHLYSVDLSSKKVNKISSFFSSHKYTDQVRCDLHPRWDREGKYICVDSTFKGKRKIILVEIG